jgi:hypothetical protein
VRQGQGNRWTLVKDIAIAAGLAAVVLAGALTVGLVVSGHLPPRGLVTGNVQEMTITGARPGAAMKLEFKQIEGAQLFFTTTDSAGRYSITLPPGRYQVRARLELGKTVVPFLVYPPDDVVIAAGAQATLDLAVKNALDLGICLAASDGIATPKGPVLVSQLRPGMVVWTLDANSHRVPMPVLLVNHLSALPGQRILRLSLADGRVVEASAGHPTVDGRHVGNLQPGDVLDGTLISAVESLAYAGDTWDLLPAGPTGAYWANDVLLGSTLAH